MEELVRKYYVHPETIYFIRNQLDGNVKPECEIVVLEARKAGNVATKKFSQQIDFNGMETEMIVPSPYDKGKSIVCW